MAHGTSSPVPGAFAFSVLGLLVMVVVVVVIHELLDDEGTAMAMGKMAQTRVELGQSTNEHE